MADHWFIVKDDKYLTSGNRFTDNFNLANLYDAEDKAVYVAKRIDGEVVTFKNRDWVVVRDCEYLGRGGKFSEDLEEAYSFSSKGLAEQYARDFNGRPVQVLARIVDSGS